jgi:polysaccharide pyruvyl transferase WcaK-like protein
VDFLLDQDADAFAALGRQPTSLTAVLDASRQLRLAGVHVRWQIPIVPELTYRLEALFSLARDERIDPVLIPPSLAWLDEIPPLDADQTRFVADFISYRVLEEERDAVPEARHTFYTRLRSDLSGRFVSEEPHQPVAVLEAHGAEWAIVRDVRPASVALIDPVAARSHGAEARQPVRTGAEVAGVLAEGARAALEWAKTIALRLGRSQSASPGPQLPRVLVIGAYGGEHIGDTAILGGVLLRIHRRYGTRQAILASQRPDHTRHLVPMLDTPVQVTVEDYQQSTVGQLLDQVDGVVFAGGPLMDLPKQLVKHLHAVSLARRADKPFVLEGIGAGPFLRWPSAWTGRRLVRMADRIAVRTSEDARAPLVRGLRPEVGRDPAFDYLETRRGELSRLPRVDREWLERLLHGADGRVTVALNLRPIRSDYTTGASARARAGYTRFVETRFEERMAEAMRQFHKASERQPCFIFFPMNAIQFGSCDLRSAYRLKRLLKADVDFRVWEGDASIDGIVALLRRIDIAITMRFHATIYALSQNADVIGIDYRIGKRDKVAALLTDAGRGERCVRVDEMTTEWLFRQLSGGSRRESAMARHLRASS